MAEKKKCPPCEEGAPAWIVTFSDLMSLLMTFFVLLLSFSTISEEDFKDAMLSLRDAFGVFEGQPSIMNLSAQNRRRETSAAAKLARQMRQKMLVEGIAKQVKIEYDAVGGLKLSLPGGVLFASGEAALKPEAYALLQTVAEGLEELPDAFIEVRGHTDAAPVSEASGFRDNFELSYYRADAVARYLYTTGGLEARQFEITALGPYHAKATNDTAEGREANRRVEIFVRGLVPRSIIEPIFERVGEEMPRRTRNYPVSPNEYAPIAE